MAHPLVKTPADIPRMESLVRLMLHKCLDAFVQGDADLARSVLVSDDDEVNRLRDAVYEELLEAMRRDSAVVSVAITLLFIARNLERIGDHATNIAEDIVFLVKGIDVRHHSQRA
jgi:phosphate transport system protein